jgi:hypothetical protein
LCLYNIYIGGSLWQSFDGFSETPDERTVNIPLTGDGPHLFEIRNRTQHSLSARKASGFDRSKYIVQFWELPG